MVAENSAACRLLRGLAQYRLDVLGEAHVEHLVGLVEHDDLKAAQVQRSPGDVVERAPGRRHHDVDATVKRTQLPADRLPAVDRQHAHAHVASVAVHRLGDLYRELARGYENQGEHPACPLRPRIRWSTGSAKAAVLPVPVAA